MAQENPQKTITQLFVDHRNRLQFYLRKRLANPEDSQELAQEAYLRLLRVSRKDYIRNPEAYLYRIARNLVHELYTGRSGSDEVSSGVEIETIAATSLAPDELADRTHRLAAVEKALSELSLKCRAVVLLTWREGLNQREVGERLGLSRSMVQKYLATGLAHCRKRIDCSA